MTTLILSGSSGCPVDAISARLGEVGLAKPVAAGEGALRSPQAWLERMAQHAEPGLAPINPGRAWQLAASEIFLSNLDAACWGWADVRHLRLLDFWTEFEPSIYFLLILSSPEEAIALAQLERGSDIDIGAVLHNWQAQTQIMLAFYHRHQTRTVLTDLRAWYAGQGLSQQPRLARWLGISPDATLDLPAISAPNPLLVLLASLRLEPHADVCALWEEALSYVPPVHQPVPMVAEASSIAVEMLASAQHWKDQALHAQQQVHARDLLFRDTEEALRTAESQRNNAQHACFALEARVAEEETVKLLVYQEKQDALELLEHANRSLALTRLERTDLEKALAASQAAWESLVREHALAVEQAAQESLDREQAFAAARAEWESLGRQQAAAEQIAPPVLDQALLEQQQRADFLSQEKIQLLEELHRVQTQAERLFFELKQAETDLAEAKEKLASLHETMPLRIEPASVEVTPLEDQTLRLILQGLELQGEKINSLEILLKLSSPYLLVLPRSPDAAQTVVLGDWHTLEPGLCERLIGLSVSEWAFVKSIATWVLSEFNKTTAAGDLEPVFDTFRQAIAACDSLFRWDDLRLVNEQRNPDYEHLWISLRHAGCGSQKWRQFDFRLGASNIRDGIFSGHLKYEFPKHPIGVPPQFEHWHQESVDDFGPKFEIRFDVSKNALDASALQSLSAADQQVLLALMGVIGRCLEQLAQRGHSIGRPWSDWREIHNRAMTILFNFVGLPATP
jgi:hypothetical protein